MELPKLFVFTALACLTIASAARGQYRWIVTYPIDDSGFSYHFTSVDCSGEVCTAVGYKEKSFLINNLCFRSTNDGATWVEQDPGLPHNEFDNSAYLLQIQQIDSLNAVAAGDSGIVVRTTDGGNTWISVDLPSKYMFGSINFSDPMTGIATVYGDVDTGIFTTSDGGANWAFAPFSPWLFSTMCHSDGGEAFRAISYENGPVYITSDNWKTVDSTPLLFPFSGLGDTALIGRCAFRGMDTLVGFGDRWTIRDSVVQPGTYPMIMTSTDNGFHWTILDQSFGLMNNIICMSSLDRDIVFAGGLVDGRQILVSTDHGMSWSSNTFIYSFDTTLREISGLTVTGDNHGVAILGEKPNPSGGGTMLLVGAPMDNVLTSPQIDSNLHIYPNPTSKTLKISGGEDGRVVQILDILGREVMHEVVPANGQLTLDVSSLPSGLYYVSNGSTRAKFVKE